LPLLPVANPATLAFIPRNTRRMAVEITGKYTGTLKMELTHGPSGAELITAAPADNQGDGSSFSPTDLVAAALGSCAVTTMAIVAQREQIPFDGASFVIEKHMRSDPRRVDRLPITIRLPPGLTPQQRERLEHVARNCPVEKSLHPDIATEFTFEY
jgi:putative redox protein